jgi:DNA-binding response OmpR family regulator
MKTTFRDKDEMFVLIVEDSALCCKLLSLYLKKAGIKFIDVSTGVKAIKACESNHNISVVLLNILLPDKNGFEVCKTIKRIRPDIEIVFQTAFNEPEYKELGFKAGASHYITKPIAYSELLAVLLDGMS